MDDSLENIERQVWERDKYRCRECGIEVTRGRGLRPHTHHMIPRAAGGTDDVDNLITLCQPCHATKLGHTFMLPRTPVEDYTQFIKWFLWDLSTDLLAYADLFDPRHPPSMDVVLQMIALWQRSLENIKQLAVDCQERGIGSGEVRFTKDFAEELQQLEGIIEGLRVCWHAHHTQRALDAIIRDKDRA